MDFKAEVITSRNNPFVKWAASLIDKKGRAQNEAFIFEGEKLTFEALEYGLPVTHIILSERALEKNQELVFAYLSSSYNGKCELKVLSESVFEKISTEKAPQGVISIVKYLDFFRKVDIIYKEDFFLKPDEKAVFLCSVRDPGNLGSVIRSAVAFGIEHIVLSSDCADYYNPKTIRAAMGSLFKVKITSVADIKSFVFAAKSVGRRVLAAELRSGAVSLSDVCLSSEDIIMIGNEGHGIPEEISDICSASVYIPISANTESLNASCAATLFMWEQSKT